MPHYTLSPAAAKVICDLYAKQGGGLLKFTGKASNGNATNQFAGTPLAQALAVLTVSPHGVYSDSLVSLRQLRDGDKVTLTLDPCDKCHKTLMRCIGILNSVFDSQFIVPNTDAAVTCPAPGAPNTDGVEFCTVIQPNDQCLCG